MPEATVRRTLVKSPPELWAEVSDTAALARHLGEFGEIRITRTDPETTVAWEGDRARGTVELEASGWGTKVTITAEPSAPAAVEPESIAVEPVAIEPVAIESVAPEQEPVAVADPGPEPVPEPVVAMPAASVPTPEPARKPGFFARLFGRRRADAEPAPVPVAATPAEPEPAPVVPLPVPTPPPAPVEVPPAAATVPPPEPVADAVPAAPALDAPAVEKILAGVLDDLGAAHHRPFSR